jgi:hypothetical protein
MKQETIDINKIEIEPGFEGFVFKKRSQRRSKAKWKIRSGSGRKP